MTLAMLKSRFLKFLEYFSAAENLSFRTHSFLFCLLMIKQILYLSKINGILRYHGGSAWVIDHFLWMSAVNK